MVDLKFKMIKLTPKKIIHCIAHCQSCTWIEEDYLTARKKAKEHTKETEHRVSIELSFYYNTYHQ